MTAKLSEREKRAWVDGLRSGRYRQGHGKLVSPGISGTDEYCCMGVCYVEVTGEKRPPYGVSFPSDAPPPLSREPDAWSNVVRVMRTPAIKYVPSDAGRGLPLHLRVEQLFAHLNDQNEWDFDTIADFVEEYF